MRRCNIQGRVRILFIIILLISSSCSVQAQSFTTSPMEETGSTEPPQTRSANLTPNADPTQTVDLKPSSTLTPTIPGTEYHLPAVEPTLSLTTRPTSIFPFYGTVFVPEIDIKTVKSLGVEVIQKAFPHDDDPEDWLAYLDEAQKYGIKVIAWLWPAGWSWDGSGWVIDDQALKFIQTIAPHPALFAIYTMNEPYWQGCFGCGYTTSQLQELYRMIKSIADIPVYTSTDSMSYWTARGPETAFADGIGDYCETWFYPFYADGKYDREKLIERITADLAIARELAPNTKIVWKMQVFAQDENFRLPTQTEMKDLAEIVYASGVDGALWYPWRMDATYDDYLSNHPALYHVINEIYERIVIPRKR